MLLRSQLPPERAREIVREAVRAVTSEMESGSDEFSAGEWLVGRTKDGVTLRVDECEDLHRVLPELARALEGRGIEGDLDVYRAARVPPVPAVAYLVECRLRVAGERLRRARLNYGWVAERAALERVVALAARWCSEGAGDGYLALEADMLPALLLPPDEDVSAWLTSDLDGSTSLRLRTVAASNTRAVAVEPFVGRVTLVQATSREGWLKPVAELTDLLREVADSSVYGFIKHGSELGQAMFGLSLTYDWPPRPGFHPEDAGLAHGAAFEDAHAPDAFAVQLLGPGYTSRVPEKPRWRHVPAGRDSVLLEHTELAAWFEHLFVPRGSGYTGSVNVGVPPVLARAREDLAPILFLPEHHLPLPR
jgi:hypothetical protein